MPDALLESRFVDALTADPSAENRPRQVPGAHYSRVLPTSVSDPELIAHSRELALDLGLETAIHSDEWLQLLSGNHVYDGMAPYAMNYGGHQFGHWAGQLGDGRAINLGELLDRHGVRQTLQLKGAGPTPYSRSADGRAVLRSSIREFLCSEAMFHLGIPTTRALSLVRTGDAVIRDMFYDGHAAPEPGAIVCRVAPSFVRFGHAQIHVSREENDLLRDLIGYVIEQHFQDETAGHDPSDPASVLAFLQTVVDRTADLMVDWMRVGFVHGVMNTDNMSILGLTIDYGPYGWLDDFDPGFTPNTTDAESRRYVYGAQPQVARWNLAKLGSALVPLVDDLESIQEVVNSFAPRFSDRFASMMAAKMGLTTLPEEDAEGNLLGDLFALLQEEETDMTLFFRALAQVDPEGLSMEPLRDALYAPPSAAHQEKLEAWLQRWARASQLEGQDPDARQSAMNRVNPWFIPRNYLAQEAIEQAESGDYAMVHEILDASRSPYEEQPGRERLAQKRPDWARDKPGSSRLSCSS